MTFLEKLQKAVRARTYTHSRVIRRFRDLPAVWREWQVERIDKIARRRRELITVESLRRGLDAETLRGIQALGEVKDRRDVFWTKYLDLDKWLALNLRHADKLGLFGQPPRDVLDLGCGAGYFLLVCRALGARVLGLDLDSDEVLNRLIELFGLQRIPRRIHAFVKLPDFHRRFDLITGFMICFNFPTNETYWGEEEWNFFINDLLRYLKPGGRIFFSLNKQPDGECYSEALKAYFLSRGAVIDGKRVLFGYHDLKRTLEQPVATVSPAPRPVPATR